MLALSIRQPFAELILRGIKTIEFRSRPTRRIGERFWIYASKRRADGSGLWAVKQADNIVVPREKPPDFDELSRVAWMIELARQVKLIPPPSMRGPFCGLIHRRSSLRAVEP